MAEKSPPAPPDRQWILAQALGTEKSSGITSKPVTKENEETTVVPDSPAAPDTKGHEETVLVPSFDAAPVAKESHALSGYLYLILIVLVLVAFFILFLAFFGGPRKESQRNI